MHYRVRTHLDTIRTFAVGFGEVAGDQALGCVGVEVCEVSHCKVGSYHYQEDYDEVGGVGFVKQHDEGEDYGQTD